MAKILSLLLFVILYTQLQAQVIVYDYDIIDSVAQNHIRSGQYSLALKAYEQIDTADMRFWDALEMRASIYQELDQYESAVQLLESYYLTGKFTKKPDLYITYGTSLVEIERFEDVDEVYQSGISSFPQYSLIYFNYAIALYNQERHQEAVDNLKKMVIIDPSAPRGHYLLGVIALESGQLSAALFSMMTYLMLNPNDDYSSNAIVLLNKKFSQNYLEEKDVKFSDVGDDFSELDVILRNELPLNKKYKLECDIDDIFPRYVQAAIEYAASHTGTEGFFESYYLPWIKPIQERKLTANLTYYMLSGMSGSLAKKIKKKQNEIDELSEQYLAVDLWGYFAKREGTEYGLDGEVTIFYEDGDPRMIGTILDGKKEGPFIYVDKYGRKTIDATYKNDLAEGAVLYYDREGRISDSSMFKNDVNHGLQTTYFEGTPTHRYQYVEGVLHGLHTIDYLSSLRYCEEYYKDGVVDSLYTCNYSNGVKSMSISVSEGQLDGQRIYYYANGQPSSEETFVDGVLSGSYKTYAIDGRKTLDIEMLEGNAVESYNYYDKDGALLTEVIVEGTSRIEKNFRKGVLNEINTYKGDNRISYQFYDGGKLRYELEYDDDGSVDQILQFTPDKPKGEKIKPKTVDFYDLEGRKIASKNYRNGFLNGASIYYYSNGKVSSTYTYDNNLGQGKVEKFHYSGQLKERYYLKDDNLHGPSEDYMDGKLISYYQYKDGKLHGPQISYDLEGNIRYKSFYSNGTHSSNSYYYNRDSSLSSIDHYKDDELLKVSFPAVNGGIETIERNGRTGLETLDLKDEYRIIEVELKHGVPDGKYTSYYQKNDTIYSGGYLNGERHGNFRAYSPAGFMRNRGAEIYGSDNGPAYFYDELGVLRVKTNYKNDVESGNEYHYFQDGSIMLKRENYEGQKDGITTYYNITGDSLCRFIYSEDLIDYFILKDTDNQFTDTVQVTNDIMPVTIKYSNGNEAMKFTIKDRYLDEKLILYSKDGFKSYEVDYQNGYRTGKRISFYPDGSIYRSDSFQSSRLHGESNYYDQNGVKLLDVNFHFSDYDGPYMIYKDGKLVKTMIFKSDSLYEIK